VRLREQALLDQSGLMDFDFIPVGPLAPLGMPSAEK
jgi:hypothetical protein